MRVEGSVTAISWIPSEAIEGLPKLPFELGVGHYDEPPPDRLEQGDLGRLRDADRFREANLLEAWIDVEDGAIVGAAYRGGGLVGSTTFRLGPKAIVVPGVPFEVLRAEPEVSGDRARFVQTVGGRAGFPAPRRVKGGPLFRIQSATAWTTLALTLHMDGRVEHEVVGASPFPRHWIYDNDGVLGVEVDGEQVAEMGPGTMLGERASLEGGVRTATLRAVTPCRLAVIASDLVAERELAVLAADRQREA